MKYYLCTIAKRKNAKRHIAGRFNTEAEAIKASQWVDKERYKVQVCTGDWSYTYHIN